MKHSLQTEMLIALLGLLLAGCVRPDSKLQTKLLGTWTQGDSVEMTFAPEGRCQSNFVGKDKEATVAGNWFFSNRWLVVTDYRQKRAEYDQLSTPWPAYTFQHPQPDAGRLVTAADGQTSTYNRK
ncbi:MAG: hypothetical protein KJ070_22645 [Verrucomicrobia bacterium]|nr:hypothetical protein [Verrucomicrobiota bacterium]